MDTKQPKALTLAAELRAGNWAPNVLQNETALRDQAAGELQLLHAEKESLRKRCDNLRVGYDAARLEIASLQAQLEAVQHGSRSEQEIVDQTEGLAKFLLSWKWGQEPESPSITMRDTINTKARICWQAACHIQDLLTGTDVENAVAEADDGAAPQPAAQALEDACEWLLTDADNGVWESACGEAWTFIDGGPVDNSVRFCHGCGKPVAIAAQQGGING